jgi:hypothetical protein
MTRLSERALKLWLKHTNWWVGLHGHAYYLRSLLSLCGTCNLGSDARDSWMPEIY